MAVFPGAVPPAGAASPSSTLAAAGHTSLHNNDRDEIRALATKVGTGSSTPASGFVLKSIGVGTSVWAQVDLVTDVTGVLPVSNGGTGASSAATARSNLGVNTALETLALAYPVGSIYINASDSTNPATLLGFGTWSAFASGRVMVGLDSGQTEFDTIGETGGAKTHWHWQTTGADGSNIFAENAGSGSGRTRVITVNRATVGSAANTTSSREDGTYDASEGMPPYIVVYMWKRTA